MNIQQLSHSTFLNYDGTTLQVSSDDPAPLSRRNLPRASHACQWCRKKKAKCNQRQPCSNCIKHSNNCVYGIKRKNARSRTSRTGSQGLNETLETQISSPTLQVEDDRYDAQTRISRSSGDEMNGNDIPSEGLQEPARSVFAHQTLPVHDSDVVGDVNQHTHGMEFYGSSSNFVLLNQLFAYAQQHLPVGHVGSNSRKRTSYLSHAAVGGENDQSTMSAGDVRADHSSALPPGRVSIINLLCNDEALLPPSRPKTPPQVTENQQSLSRDPLSHTRHGKHIAPRDSEILSPHPRIDPLQQPSNHSSSTIQDVDSTGYASHIPLRVAEVRLEREYVRSFLHNMHYIHPMLDAATFTSRCEKEVWAVHTHVQKAKDKRHFFALYNIVVAVGALVAGSSVSQDLDGELKTWGEHWQRRQSLPSLMSSQTLSKTYFRKSRALIGDVFEVCSLESAQALLLMSLYCQNSLKPHACYMYCGMAVRTALAIGLPSESMSISAEGRRAARRTWWCIYSHEIDMSCSSGRRDSLGKPRNYQIPLPEINDKISVTTETENSSIAMINEMVHFAAVLRRISKEIYHDSKGLTMLQKSSVALELDALLDDWKVRLPKWLDFDRISFREEEWAAKQKVVLHLRYLNARILLHRPFLAASASRGQLQTQQHVKHCLEAARETIRLLYESYANRHYFRTWWYNSTYTLYAGMIVLYVIMLGHHTVVPSNALLDDVIKSRDILQSMEEATVARRSADLIREGLEVAQGCIQHRESSYEAARSDVDNSRPQGQTTMNETSFGAEDEVSRTLFSQTGADQDTGVLLASLIDPTVLQDFTAGNSNIPGLDFTTFPLDDSFSCGPDDELATIMQWHNDEYMDHVH